jgi:putative tricarboxylic transport membrane protein
MKRPMQFSERVIPIILIVLAVSVIISIWRLPNVATADQVGPRLFPWVIALSLTVISGLLLMGATTSHKKDADITLQGMLRRFLPLMFFLVLYVIALPWLGFLITTTAMLVASFRLLGERRLWLNFIIAVGCTAATYLLFATALGIQLTAFPG